MRAQLGDIELVGTPEQIVQAVAGLRRAQEKKPRPQIPDHDCDDTGPGCHICAGLGQPAEPTVTDDTY